MGFCTTINPTTGREVLTCDFCGSYPARKMRCPYGYCQAWATCQGCKAEGKHKFSSCSREKATHAEVCKKLHLEYEQKQNWKEEHKAEGIICSAIADLTNNTVVVATTSGDWYRLPREHYDYTRNDTPEGTIAGLRNAGVYVIESSEAQFREAQSS